MTIEELVAVKFAGVATVSERPLSVTLLVAAALTVTVVEVAEDGDAPPVQPVVINEPAVEVA
jgi:hypothetical protein